MDGGEFERKLSIAIKYTNTGNTQKQEKKEETLTEKMKKSPDKRHTQTQGSLIGTF